MSNYNSQLQSHNADLQMVLQTLQTKAAGGGSGEAAEWSENEDAMVTSTLSNYTNDRVISIGNDAFYSYAKLTTVSFPAAKIIGNDAFHDCTSLTTASFPAATTIGSYAFYNCSRLTTASFPAATTIGSYAFYDCSRLTTVSFPAAKIIGNDAFHTCTSLTTVSFPAATSIGNYVFYSCSSLTTVSFPVATTIGASAFYDCAKLTTVSFPVAKIIGSYAFRNCSRLTTASFPVVKIIESNAFQLCTSLTTASFPVATTIGGYAFNNCYNLKSLYLTNSKVCTLTNSNTFGSTPIGGYSASAGTYGSIYVPASLLTSYQTATNWTYFSSRFSAVENSPDWDGTYGSDSDVSDNLIMFTINGTEYQAVKDMTWSDWCNSQYNILGLYDDGYAIVLGSGPMMKYIYDQDFNAGMSGKLIIEGYDYILAT